MTSSGLRGAGALFWRAAAFAVLAGLWGCEPLKDNAIPVEGTTWRVEEPKPSPKGDVKIDIFADRSECRNADHEVSPDELDDCIPRVDRGSGEVELGFRLIDKATGNVLYLPVTKDQLTVAYADQGVPGDHWDLIQHGPMRAGQLFVILIDGSSSIYTTGGINKIRRALNTPEVVDAFLPAQKGGVPSAVVLLRFNEDVKTLDGKDPLQKGAIIESRKDYTAMVKDHLESSDRGYSHVYSAVTYASTKLLEAPEIHNWLQVNNASPTIVLLTDGFNNEDPRDTCKSNLTRLNDALDTLVRVRATGGAAKPTIYTVGLGEAKQKAFPFPPPGRPTEGLLCKGYADEIINGNLEAKIDNPSLAWLADAGGGKTYVSNNHKGLADVFLEAAAQRYKWYEIRYRVDSFHLRKSFATRIQLSAYAQAESTITFHPSAWLDAPSGIVPEGETWFVATSFRRTFVPVMDLLGVLVFLGFLGPATFNARRALFRRARRAK